MKMFLRGKGGIPGVWSPSGARHFPRCLAPLGFIFPEFRPAAALKSCAPFPDAMGGAGLYVFRTPRISRPVHSACVFDQRLLPVFSRLVSSPVFSACDVRQVSTSVFVWWFRAVLAASMSGQCLRVAFSGRVPDQCFRLVVSDSVCGQRFRAVFAASVSGQRLRISFSDCLRTAVSGGVFGLRFREVFRTVFPESVFGLCFGQRFPTVFSGLPEPAG